MITAGVVLHITVGLFWTPAGYFATNLDAGRCLNFEELLTSLYQVRSFAVNRDSSGYNLVEATGATT